MMKKELKRMKVAEDTYFVRKFMDNRSRRDNWKQTKYVRSDSKPGYLRTSSRGNYVRDN